MGWAALVIGLPIAFLAVLFPPNEYQATLAINALDCNGPSKIYLFAVPALLIYGVGFVVNGWRWRRRKLLNGIVALLCLAICAAVVVNVARAVKEESRQAASCG